MLADWQQEIIIGALLETSSSDCNPSRLTPPLRSKAPICSKR